MTHVYKQHSGFGISVNANGQCRASVHSDFYIHQCRRKGVNEEGGMLWCKQHTPSIVKAKDREKQDIFNAEQEVSRAKWKLDAAAPKLLKALEKFADAVDKDENWGVFMSLALKARELIKAAT